MSMKKYFKDYEIISTVDENGKEKETKIYKGDYFEISLSNDNLLHYKRLCLILTVAILLLHTIGGTIDNLGMRNFYVILPYVIVFLPLVYMAEGVLKLPKEKRKYKREEVELSFKRIKTTSSALIVLFGITLIGEILFLFLNLGEVQIWSELAFLVLEGFSAIAIYMIINSQRDILITKIDENKENQKK